MAGWWSLSRVWWPYFSLHMVECSLFILLVYLLDRGLRLHPAFRYHVWSLALLKVFLPPLISLPHTLAPLPETVRGTLLSLQMLQGSAPASVPASTFGWIDGLFVLWLLSLPVMAALMLRHSLWLRQQLKGARPVPHHELERCSGIDLPARLAVYTCAGLTTPLFTGFFRPRLYLPEDYHRWGKKPLQSIVTHELCHYQNRDMIMLALQNLAIFLFGLNPLIWLMHLRLLQTRELRSDLLAIRKTGISPRDYTRLLYSFVERQQRGTPSMMGLYFVENKATLFQRFSYLLTHAGSESVPPAINQTVVLRSLILVLVLLSFRYPAPADQHASTTPQFRDTERQPAESAKTPPALPDGEATQQFEVYDTPPFPVGGFRAIQQNFRLPETYSGPVVADQLILNVLIGTDGRVEKARILKSSGIEAIDRAAIEAVRRTAWTPAYLKGKAVRVWIGIPIIVRAP